MDELTREEEMRKKNGGDVSTVYIACNGVGTPFVCMQTSVCVLSESCERRAAETIMVWISIVTVDSDQS